MSEKCNWDPSLHDGKPCPVHDGSEENKETNADREKAIGLIKKITDRINATDVDDPEGYLTEGEADFIKMMAEKYEIDADELREIGGNTFDKNWGYNADDYAYKKPSVDALYRPDEDKGPKEGKGPANPNAPAGQVLYNEDVGSEVAGFGRLETLDEYFERVKDKHDIDDEDWHDYISERFGLGHKQVKAYLDSKKEKSKDDFLDNLNDTPAVRKTPNGKFEVDRDGTDNWEEIEEDEFNKLKEKGMEEIDYEEAPDARDDDDLEQGLDELIDAVPNNQKEAAKKIKKKLASDDNDRKA